MPETQSRLRRWLFPIFAAFLSLIITLLALELSFWLILHKKWPRKPSIPTVNWVILTPRGRRLKPDLNEVYWSEISGQEVKIRTNSLGFRAGEIPPEKTPGAFRILVLGDSITLSAFLPEEQTYPDLVEKILREKKPVEVINAGVYDVGLEEELWILKESGLKLNPDLVLLAFYLNDSRPPWGFEDEYYRLPAWLINSSKTLEQSSYLYKWLWKRFLVRHFLGRKMTSRFDWIKLYRTTDWQTDQAAYEKLIRSASLDWGAAWTGNSWPKIYSGLEELEKLAGENKFKPAIVIFPVAVQVRSEFADDYPQQKIREYCESRRIPCLDLLPILRAHKTEKIFFDHCHLTELGNQIIAQPIAEFLLRQTDLSGRNVAPR